MRVPITYISSSGQSFNLISNGVLHKDANYHNWKLSAEGTKLQYGFRVADFSMDAAQYKTTLIFYGPEHKRRTNINALHDAFEYDVRHQSPGRLIWGDFYIDCYVIEGSTEPTDMPCWTSMQIVIFAANPFWIREHSRDFYAQGETVSTFLDYDYDYDYDYMAPAAGTERWVTDIPFESEFIMTIFGAAVNPRIEINGYPYLLYTTINAGEYVVIDSRKATITLYQSDGTQTSLFDSRNKAKSVFQKIPAGTLDISWSASFGFNLLLYEERLEPKI